MSRRRVTRVIDDRELRKRLRTGKSVTLVLGAGVNRKRGLPLWPELLQRTWKRVFDEDPHALEADFLERARSACKQAGLPERFVERLDVKRHPLELQFAFEQIYDSLRWRVDDFKSLQKFGKMRARRILRISSKEQRVAELFVEILRQLLYQGRPSVQVGRSAPLDTLALVARAVRRNAMLPEHERRITQVITLNVDDLLERAVNLGCRRQIPWAVPICRAAQLRPIPSPRCIAIYHLHGFVPLNAAVYPWHMENGTIDQAKPPAESLVFTDEQYWRMARSPDGFASRVFLNALNRSCVFVGLSMTDINILRWLANDAIERSDDFRRLASRWDSSEATFTLGEELSRHYWITEASPSDDAAERFGEPSRRDILTSTLRRRGVERITIPSWECKTFHEWWRSCFEPEV
jgi:hypothetical protein